MRILLAVDEFAENSHRVVQYVGSLLGRTPNVVITLFHVLETHAARIAGAWWIGESRR